MKRNVIIKTIILGLLFIVIIAMSILNHEMSIRYSKSGGKTSDGLSYVIHNNEVAVLEYDGDSEELIIPSEIKGFPVIYVAESFKSNAVKSIVISEGVREIGASSFNDMVSLEHVQLPNSMRRIEGDVFTGCTNLVSINIPEQLVEIGNYSFGNCESLKKVTFNSILTNLEEQAFQGCSSLKEVIFTSNMNRIGEGAFSNCESLEKVTLPIEVRQIDDGAFENCIKLANVQEPQNIMKISASAFSHTPWMESKKKETFVILGNSLLSQNVTGDILQIPSEVNCLADGIDISGIREIIFPSDIKSIKMKKFIHTESLKTIKVMDGIEDIEISESLVPGLEKIEIYGLMTVVYGLSKIEGEGVNMTVVGKEDSYAQMIAERYGIPFGAVGED